MGFCAKYTPVASLAHARVLNPNAASSAFA
jgi:hypothetical protein